MRADRHAYQPDAAGQPVRPGRHQLRGRAGLQPHPDRGAGAGWIPAKAVAAGLNKRQIDENVVFNLAATQPDLLTGFNPATGQPEPYGSDGTDINCAVIGYTNKAPTANLAPPAPGSQFPPR